MLFDGQRVLLTFNRPIIQQGGQDPSKELFFVSLNGGNSSEEITAVKHSTNDNKSIIISIADPIKNDDQVGFAYRPELATSSSVKLEDDAGEFVGNILRASIENDSRIKGVGPVLVTAQLAESGDEMLLSYDDALFAENREVDLGSFTIKANGKPIGIRSIQFVKLPETKKNKNEPAFTNLKGLLIELTSPIENNATVFLSYIVPTIETLRVIDGAGNEAKAFTDVKVINASKVPGAPPTIKSIETDQGGGLITIVFDERIKFANNKITPTRYTIKVNKNVQTIDQASLGQSDDTLLLRMNTAIPKGNPILFTYDDKDGVDGDKITDLQGNAVIKITDFQVTNNSQIDPMRATAGKSPTLDFHFSKVESLDSIGAHSEERVLTHQRLGPATYINDQGYVTETVIGNLLTGTESMAYWNTWNKNRVSAQIVEQDGPDGILVDATAIKDKLESNPPQEHNISQSVINNLTLSGPYFTSTLNRNTHAFSVYLKPGENCTEAFIKVGFLNVLQYVSFSGNGSLSVNTGSSTTGYANELIKKQHGWWEYVVVGKPVSPFDNEIKIGLTDNSTNLGRFIYNSNGNRELFIFAPQITEGVINVDPPMLTGVVPTYKPRFTQVIQDLGTKDFNGTFC